MISQAQDEVRNFIAKKSRRRFIKLLSILPFAGNLALFHSSFVEQQLDNDHIFVEGWILKKSDLVDDLE